MIREPTEYEARNLLLSSGIRFEDKGHYYSIRCPFHKNGMEKQASAALYKANWFFKCFDKKLICVGFSYRRRV